MPDPSVMHGTRDQKLDAYRQVRDALQAKIQARLARPVSGAPGV